MKNRQENENQEVVEPLLHNVPAGGNVSPAVTTSL